jgi:hypothetical protein
MEREVHEGWVYLRDAARFSFFQGRSLIGFHALFGMDVILPLHSFQNLSQNPLFHEACNAASLSVLPQQLTIVQSLWGRDSRKSSVFQMC